MLRIFALVLLGGNLVLTSHFIGRWHAPSTQPMLLNGERLLWSNSSKPRALQTKLTNNWRGIIPLQSTRSDVERILGAQTDSHGQTSIYKTESERIDVLYSSGLCSRGQTWRLPRDIVIRLVVTPESKTLIEHFDTKGYVQVKESHPDNWRQYWSPDGGVLIQTIKTDEAEEVLSVTYQAARNEKTPKCPAPRRRPVVKSYPFAVLQDLPHGASIPVYNED